jgi:hypothetical protein
MRRSKQEIEAEMAALDGEIERLSKARYKLQVMRSMLEDALTHNEWIHQYKPGSDEFAYALDVVQWVIGFSDNRPSRSPEG